MSGNFDDLSVSGDGFSVRLSRLFPLTRSINVVDI